MQGRVAVLEGKDSTTIADAVKSLGFLPIQAGSVAELEASLSHGLSTVAVIAFEALASDAQAALRSLRNTKADARLIVVFLESGARSNLVQRLWSVGAFDYMVPRARLATELRTALRQSVADSLLQELTPDAGQEPIRMLQQLSAALGNHKQVDSLLRELQRRLPNLVSFEVLEILVLLGRPRVFVFQRTPLPHQVVWSLSEKAVEAVRAVGAPEIDLATTEFVYADPSKAHGETGQAPSAEGEMLVVPMMFCGDPIGCVSMLSSGGAPFEPRDRQLVQLLVHQLSISLLHADTLERAEALSVTDPLTGLHNRRYLDKLMANEWERCTRYRLQLCVLLLDIDHFKRINDVHGHMVGDAALRRVAEILRGQIRLTDTIIRFGGEEFLIVLPETHVTGATILFERIRIALKTSLIDVGDHDSTGLQITVSGGLAAVPNTTINSPDKLIELADDALLAAKRGGRDRLCVAEGMEQVDDTSEANKRRYPRLEYALSATFIPIRDADARPISLTTVNVSANGLGVNDDSRRLEHDSYGLVFLEERHAPFLGRVRWTSGTEQQTRAGIEFIRPAEFLSRSIAPPTIARAIVVAMSANTIRLAARCLRLNHYEALTFLGGDELGPGFDIEGYSLVVVSESALSQPIGQAILEARRLAKQPIQIVVISEQIDRDRALDLIRTARVDHLVSVNQRPEQSLFATLNKLVRGEYFGVRRYLQAGADTKKWIITSSAEKADVLAGIRQVAIDVECHPRIQDLLLSAVDEMLLNALIHGGDSRPVTVECGADGDILATSVLDENGLLDIDDIYRGLQTARSRSIEGVPEGLETAGLGFRIMLDSLSQVVVNVEPGRRTEVIGIVDLGTSLREHRSAAPGLGLFGKRRNTDEAR
jgi:diguanylate cyclase (GGDEF)-like protein